MSTTFAIFLIGVALLYGLIAKAIFERFRIPDVLLLIGLGAGLSYLGLTSGIAAESKAIEVILTFALIYVVFTGALPISARAIFSTAKWASLSSTLNFIGISIAVSLISILLGFPPNIAIALGFLMCVIDGSIVNAILDSVKFTKRSEAFIQIESAIVDIMVIVAVISMVSISAMTPERLLQQGINFLFLSSAIGVAAGVVWGLFIKRLNSFEHLSLTTMAVLLLLYVFAEYFKANGVITVFTFAITIGNLNVLRHIMYKDDAKDLGALNRDQKVFFRDLSFLLRTLLFVFIGTLVDFKKPLYLLLGLLLVIVAYTIRSFLFGLIKIEEATEKENNMMQVMATKGLTPIVMMQLIRGSPEFTNTMIGAIFFSVSLTSVLIFLIERGWFVSIRFHILELARAITGRGRRVQSFPPPEMNS